MNALPLPLLRDRASEGLRVEAGLDLAGAELGRQDGVVGWARRLEADLSLSDLPERVRVPDDRLEHGGDGSGPRHPLIGYPRPKGSPVDRHSRGLSELGVRLPKLGAADGIHAQQCTRLYNGVPAWQ
jgi:hypothetical protein